MFSEKPGIAKDRAVWSRGYRVFDIGRDEWRTDVTTMDKVSEPGGRATVTTSFVVERGRVALNRVS